MALQQVTNMDYMGINLPVAYHHIKDVNVRVLASQTVIDVEIYADAAARAAADVGPVTSVTFIKPETMPVINMANPQEYGYTYLKTLPDYVGAQDV